LSAQKAKATAIAYDATAVAALKACRAYLRDAEEFLEGRCEELPDPSGIAATRFPQSSIVTARHTGEDAFGRGLPFIAAVIEDREHADKERSERYFDPWYFAIMLLLELPGGRFRFDISKRKYHYLAFAGTGRSGNFYLRRLICDTSSKADTREKGGEGAHYDYRRITLKPTAKETIRAAGQETLILSRTREDAIQFALELFERQLNGKSKLPVLDLGRDEYAMLLRSAFDIADRMHEARHTPQTVAASAD
jgi:hypothetical protein